MTQQQRIQRHLQDFGSISSIEAFQDYGITRLSARIWDLRHAGVKIHAEDETRLNRYGERVRYARYRLEDNHAGTE